MRVLDGGGQYTSAPDGPLTFPNGTVRRATVGCVFGKTLGEAKGVAKLPGGILPTNHRQGKDGQKRLQNIRAERIVPALSKNYD